MKKKKSICPTINEMLKEMKVEPTSDWHLEALKQAKELDHQLTIGEDGQVRVKRQKKLL